MLRHIRVKLKRFKAKIVFKLFTKISNILRTIANRVAALSKKAYIIAFNANKSITRVK